MNAPLIAITDNEVMLARLTAVARKGDHPLVASASLDGAVSDVEPTAVVVDLALAGAVDTPIRFRARWPRTLIAAFVSVPDRSLWESAQSAGFDLVATRGTIASQLQALLSSWEGPRARRRVKLADHADLAGRIGLVTRVAETPVGAVALYQIGGVLHAAQDRCPHAGATLSEGELQGTVITCPRHGSRFDVATGARVRGPADTPLAVYEVAVDGGVVYVELD